jgi:TolA-binding protein
MRCKTLVYVALCVTAGGVTFLPALSQPGFYDLAASDQSKAVNLKMQRSYALATYQNKNFSEALNRWRLIVDAGSKEAYDLYWLGQSYYHLKMYPEAANAFRQATELDKSMDNAKVKLVESYLASKNLAEARSACNEALSTVTDPYAKKQIETMSKIANHEQSLPVFKFDSGAENPNNGRK